MGRQAQQGGVGTASCTVMEDVKFLTVLLWCPRRSYLILRIAYRQLSSGTTDDIREEDD